MKYSFQRFWNEGWIAYLPLFLLLVFITALALSSCERQAEQNQVDKFVEEKNRIDKERIANYNQALKGIESNINAIRNENYSNLSTNELERQIKEGVKKIK